MCKHDLLASSKLQANAADSRTYGKDIGEDIREGYEPPDEVAIDDSTDAQGEQFTVGEDEDGPSPHDSEESRQWQQATEPEVFFKPKYGLEGEEFENVWGGGEHSESPKENP